MDNCQISYRGMYLYLKTLLNAKCLSKGNELLQQNHTNVAFSMFYWCNKGLEIMTLDIQFEERKTFVFQENAFRDIGICFQTSNCLFK